MVRLNFRQPALNRSALNGEASWTAFQMRKMPIGSRTNVETKAPIQAVVAPSLASLVPVRSTTQ